MENKKVLRIGRVYHIKPTPIPPMKAKERDAIFVGWKLVFGKKMPVFIQIGSTPYHDADFNKFNNDIKYFWNAIEREGFLHIAVSKPEVLRVVKNVYTKKKKYIDLKRGDAKRLFNLWEMKINKLKSERWRKAFANFLLGKEKESLKQLYLLKHTMAWEYKFLKPIEQLKKWKEKSKFNND